jgi:hypothetical protein
MDDILLKDVWSVIISYCKTRTRVRSVSAIFDGGRHRSSPLIFAFLLAKVDKFVFNNVHNRFGEHLKTA